MSCQSSKCGSSNPCNSVPVSECHCNNNSGFLIVVVLYILLAIIIGAWIWN